VNKGDVNGVDGNRFQLFYCSFVLFHFTRYCNCYLLCIYRVGQKNCAKFFLQ